MRRAEIIKGVETCKRALNGLSEGEMAIVFARVVSGFSDPEAGEPLAVLETHTHRRAIPLKQEAARKTHSFADLYDDPRPELVLTLKEVRT